MWTDPDALAQWWGPDGFTTRSIALDVRAGGRFRIEMQPAQGHAFFLTGEFCVVKAPALLIYTFRWEDPDPDDRDNVVTLTLAGVGESTDVTVDQGPFRTEARREFHAEGWVQTLDRLEAVLASPTPHGPSAPRVTSFRNPRTRSTDHDCHG
jgi:uncharacterized protein YndB with AHSA1/START domain